MAKRRRPDNQPRSRKIRISRRFRAYNFGATFFTFENHVLLYRNQVKIRKIAFAVLISEFLFDLASFIVSFESELQQFVSNQYF